MKTPHDRTVVQCTVFPSSRKSCFKSNKLSLNLKMSRFLLQAHPNWQRDIVQWRRCWSLRSCMYSIPIPVGNWLCFDPISMYSRGVRGCSIWSVETFPWRKKTAVLLDFVHMRGGPCPNFLSHFQGVHFWSIERSLFLWIIW